MVRLDANNYNKSIETASNFIYRFTVIVAKPTEKWPGM